MKKVIKSSTNVDGSMSEAIDGLFEHIWDMSNYADELTDLAQRGAGNDGKYDDPLILSRRIKSNVDQIQKDLEQLREMGF